MKSTFAILTAGAVAANLRTVSFYESQHAAWKAEFPESLSTLQAFADNCDTIETHNAGNETYAMGHNQFSGLTATQFKSLYLNNNFEAFDAAREKNYDMTLTEGPVKAFAKIDWVAKGAVTPVKDQAQCGSCWAFSTVAGMEGQLFVAEGKLLSMSEQDLVSCDKNGDQGCNGGLMDNAFTWIQSNGICSESAYPYTSGTGNSGTCKKTCKSVATCTGHKDVPKGSESGLYTALKKAPVSIAVDAGKFQLYKSGILDPAAGCGKQLDHGVTLVGYGTDGAKDYWSVKNSWGASWGEKGYIRLVYGKDECGLADAASQPTGVKSL